MPDLNDAPTRVQETTPGLPRVVAILAMRNEALYLRLCLEHLIRQGLDVYIIDNESTDGSASIAERYLGRGVIGIETFPFTGFFEWDEILSRKEALGRELDADWFMHQDPDEIRVAPAPFATLREAVGHADRAGYNAINFEEFVFVPTDEEEDFEGRDYVSEMRCYYYFAPRPLRQLKLWKRHADARLSSSGGHNVSFPGRKIYPENFVLKHYMGLSKRQLLDKYTQRPYAPRLLARGWHRARAAIDAERLTLPPRARLKRFVSDRQWDRSEPWTRHFFVTS